MSEENRQITVREQLAKSLNYLEFATDSFNRALSEIIGINKKILAESTKKEDSTYGLDNGGGNGEN